MVEVDHGESSQRPVPQLDSLVESALSLFHSKHTYIYQGIAQGYYSGIAAEDAVAKSGFSTDELYKTLTRQTDITPEEIYTDIPSQETWEEFEKHIVEKIVELELEKKHPEIEAEDDVRLNWESRSYSAWLQEKRQRAS